MLRPPVEILKRERHVMFPCGLLQRALGRRHDFTAHAVARYHRDCERLHGNEDNLYRPARYPTVRCIRANQPEYDENGVDLTLIRWMMDMTPSERLETMQSFANAVWRARGERGES